MKTYTNLYIRRFSNYRIIEHQLNAVVFALLVITGLSQKFHDSAFSQWIIASFGGIDMMRLVHRSVGVVFTALLAAHTLQAAIGIVYKRWQPSMIVTIKDFKDAVENIFFYFGLAKHPARCDRYDYRQKFEY